MIPQNVIALTIWTALTHLDQGIGVRMMTSWCHVSNLRASIKWDKEGWLPFISTIPKWKQLSTLNAMKQLIGPLRDTPVGTLSLTLHWELSMFSMNPLILTSFQMAHHWDAANGLLSSAPFAPVSPGKERCLSIIHNIPHDGSHRVSWSFSVPLGRCYRNLKADGCIPLTYLKCAELNIKSLNTW